MKVELGGLFENCPKSTSMRTDLADMGHLQTHTPVATYNTAANSIFNGTAKKNISINRNDILLGQRHNPTKPIPHILERGKENMAEYTAKHHPLWHYRAMRDRYTKETKKDIENSKYQGTGTGRGCAGYTNPGGTRKPDNSLKGIWNPIPQDPDNPLKGIRDLVQNGTQG